MRSNAGAGPLLVQAALREHNRLVDVELTSENWDKAVWLFRQEIRLRNGVEPGSEDLCLLLYQFATLQYTRYAASKRFCGQTVARTGCAVSIATLQGVLLLSTVQCPY